MLPHSIDIVILITTELSLHLSFSVVLPDAGCMTSPQLICKYPAAHQPQVHWPPHKTRWCGCQECQVSTLRIPPRDIFSP